MDLIVMEKILVAYFSASGTTKKLAENLAKAIGGDIFEIEPAKKYTEADLDWTDKNSRSSLEMADISSRPEIANKVRNFGEYKYIFLGFPIWWYREPSIVDTFLEEYDFAEKIVIPFATSGESGLGNTAKNIQNLIKNATVKNGKRFSFNVTLDELKTWAYGVIEK